MAPLGVALSAFALLVGAAASSAAAQAPAVAEATTDGAPNLPTLADAALVDPKPADTTSADPRTLANAAAATSGASSWYASTADRRALRGCNPKKNTSCCRAPRHPPRRPPPAAVIYMRTPAPPPRDPHPRGRADVPTPSAR